MPIQIFELTIRVTVEDERRRQAGVNLNRYDMLNQQDLISECVEQTLKHLEQLKER